MQKYIQDLTKLLSRTRTARDEAKGQISAAGTATPPVPSTAGDYTIGDKVSHPTFGEGRVVSIKGQGEEAEVIVGFPQKGIKKLLAQYARLQKL